MKVERELYISITRRGGKTDVLRAERGIMLGRDAGCDISIENARLPGRHLFIERIGKERFIVKLLEGMDGSLRKGKESSSISSLISSGFIKKRGEVYELELTPGLTLTVVIGATTIEASYAEVFKPLGKRGRVFIPFITPHEQVFLIALITSAIVHISFAYYLSTMEIKEKPFEEKIYEITPRFARLILTPEKKAVERKIIEPMEEKKPEEEEKVVEPVEEKPAVAAKAEREKLVKKVARKGVLGVIGAKKGLIADVGGVMPWREVDKIIKEARIVRPAEETIEGIGSGVTSVSGEEVLKEWEVKKTVEDIMKEKKAPTVVSPVKKKVIEKRKREEADVYRIVRSYTGGLKYLYNNALRENPKLRGTITVRLVITKEGDVDKAVIENSTLANPELERAIVERIYIWKFGSVKDVENLVIDYTFDFSPIG